LSHSRWARSWISGSNLLMDALEKKLLSAARRLR
jgi:hypothetical protein